VVLLGWCMAGIGKWLNADAGMGLIYIEHELFAQRPKMRGSTLLFPQMVCFRGPVTCVVMDEG
jgi:hypothetical protein